MSPRRGCRQRLGGADLAAGRGLEQPLGQGCRDDVPGAPPHPEVALDRTAVPQGLDGTGGFLVVGGEHAVHVRRRPTDVQGHHVPVRPGGGGQDVGDDLDPREHRVGGRTRDEPGEPAPARQALAPDHVGDEDLPDRAPGRPRVQHADPGDDVVGGQHHPAAHAQQGGRLRGRLRVPGEDDRDARAGPAQDTGVVQQDLGIAPVGPADHEHDIGARRHQRVDPRAIEAPRGHGHHTGACGQRHTAARLGGDDPLVPDHGQAQPTARRGAHDDRGVRHPTNPEPGDSGVQADEHVRR